VSFLIPAFHRDLPYDWSTMVENVADPAHVAFAHHGVQGNRDKVKYGDYELKLVRDPDHLVVQQKSAFGGQGYLTFEPPSVVNYITILPDGGYTSFRLHATPTAPGACRLVAVMSTNRRLPARLLFRLVRLAPSWLDHILFRHPVRALRQAVQFD